MTLLVFQKNYLLIEMTLWRLPEGVKVISNNAFENCQRLEKVEFPSTLERIESEAFLNCFNLKSAQYGKDVKIDPTSFKGCANLTY